MRMQWWDTIEAEDVQMNQSSLFLFAHEDIVAARTFGFYGNAHALHVTSPDRLADDLRFVRDWLKTGRAVVVSSEILVPIKGYMRRVREVMSALADIRDEVTAGLLDPPRETPYKPPVSAAADRFVCVA